MSGKIIFLILCILPIALGVFTAGEKEIQRVVDACAIENGYPADRYKYFVFWDLNYKLDHCVTACAMSKLGTMNNGVFTGEQILAFLSKYPDNSGARELEEIVIKCAKEYGTGGEDNCKTVENLHGCFAEGLLKVMDSDWTLNGSINQFLMYTDETFE